jgi:hypothetical protein
MGIGPIEAIPRVLRQAGISQHEVDWFELNEAFAAQALAVMRTLDLDPAKVNPLGGAIALGHPLGATGAIRTATLVHGLQRTKQRYGMVTMCIGTGMGAAGLFERPSISPASSITRRRLSNSTGLSAALQSAELRPRFRAASGIIARHMHTTDRQ